MGLEEKKQYIDKIEEQAHLIAFQKMILDVSFEFMNINQENYDRKVRKIV